MTWNDPKLYREMSVPHESMESAMAEATAFIEGVKALREKHRIPDVYIIGELTVIDEKQEEKGVVFNLGMGYSMKHEVLISRALGIVRKEHRDILEAALHRKDIEG